MMRKHVDSTIPPAQDAGAIDAPARGALASADSLTRIPLRLVSLANRREHWSVRARRASRQRRAAFEMVPRHALPCIVTITRIAPRKLDTDNLAISGKHVRDGVADRLGVNDNDPRVEWRYDQRPGAKREYAVEILITQRLMP